jgi:hypothetical protein
MNKILLVFRNMIKCLYSLCSWNAISCCILWQSHNLYQTKWVMRIVVWIVLKWLLEQVNWPRIFDIIKAMWKIVSVLWNGRRNMKQCFFIIAFLTWKNLDIVGSQIEIKIIFSLIGLLTNLKRRHADCSWRIYFCEKKLAQWSCGK